MVLTGEASNAVQIITSGLTGYQSTGVAARITMTITHADRLPGHGELDRPTETSSFVAFWTGHMDS
jgi:hypothetical protein